MTTDDDNGSDGRRAVMAEFVLGLLDPATHARIARQVEIEPRLRAERDFWQAHFARMDDAFEPATPPSRVAGALERRLFGETRSNRWNSLALWRGLAAGALAVAVVSVGFNVMRPAPNVSTLTNQLVAALNAEGSDVSFLALYDGTGTVRLTALSGAEVPDHDLELWAIQGGGAPISMGVIPVGQSTVAISPEVLAGWGEGSVLAITLEQEGGSPDGTPKGPVVAQGAVTHI